MTKTERIKIYFMGAGSFAIPVLRALAASHRIDLAGVVTQPDKTAGRRRILTPCPLGKWADSNGISCVRVPNVNTEAFLAEVRATAPDLIVVVSFGQLLKQPLLDIPKIECLNIHASLLPRYRGASPIISAILNGDSETGVSFMRMERGLDSGPVHAVSSLKIPPGITAEQLEILLSELAGERIEEILKNIVSGKSPALPQCEDQATLAAKIRKSDGSVNWQDDAIRIERQIRAYAKWPTMCFCIQGRNRPLQIKITAARATDWNAPGGDPGKILAFVEKGQMMVQCGHGALLIERVLPEGKREMTVSDFINGAHLGVGGRLLNGPDVPPPQDIPHS